MIFNTNFTKHKTLIKNILNLFFIFNLTSILKIVVDNLLQK